MTDAKGRLVLIVRELREARIREGLSQAEVARGIGTTQAYVSYLEQGKKVPTLEIAKAWADLVGLDLILELRPRKKGKKKANA